MSIRPLLLTVLALLAGGCLDLRQTLTLNRNGSGLLHVSYSMTEQTITQLKGMLKLQDQLSLTAGEPVRQDIQTEFTRLLLDPTEDRLRRKIAGYEANGVKIEKLAVETRNAVRYVEMKLTFDSLADVIKTDFFREYGFSLTRGADGNYTLHRPPEIRTSDELVFDPTDPVNLQMLSPILGGFRVNLDVKTPSSILSTTAHRKSLYTATWVFEFDKDPKALTQLQRQEFLITFDGKDLSLPQFARKSSGP